MNIKYASLNAHLRHNLSSVYVLIGQDPTLIQDAEEQIHSACRQRGDLENYRLELNTTNDWNTLFDLANNFSLFSEYVYIDAHYIKKTLDQASQKLFQNYLEKMNSRCFITLKMTQVPMKQLQWLTNQANVTLVQIQSLTPKALQSWIVSQLQAHSLQYDSEVPQSIHQYNQNNLAGCKQLIEILALSYPQSKITLPMLRDQLTEQSEFQLYELAEACLMADALKIRQIIRQSQQKHTELTYILAVLTKEIRQLIQVSHFINQSFTFADACQKLKIWQNRTAHYKQALKYLSSEKLFALLMQAQKLDERIKSSATDHLWLELERFALKFCPTMNL